MAVTIQDLLNDPRYKDNKSLILLAKPDIVPPKPRKKKKQKPPKYFLDFADEMRAFIKKQEKFNNFVIEQFKAHGWVK